MSSEEESEEELPVAAAENGKFSSCTGIYQSMKFWLILIFNWQTFSSPPGKAKTDAKTAKANTGKPDAVKQAVKIAEVSNNKKTKDDDDDSNSEDESGSDEEDDSDDEDELDEVSFNLFFH